MKPKKYIPGRLYKSTSDLYYNWSTCRTGISERRLPAGTVVMFLEDKSLKNGQGVRYMLWGDQMCDLVFWDDPEGRENRDSWFEEVQ